MARRFQVQVSTAAFPFEAKAGEDDPSGLTYFSVDWLEPLFLSVVSNGEMGEFRCFAAKHPEDAVATCQLHRGIRVIDTENSDELVFNGVIVKTHIVYGGIQERFEVVAYNSAEYLLHRICLHGQHRMSHVKEQANFTSGFVEGAQDLADDDVIHIDTQLVFNPDGEPNRNPQIFNWASDSTFAANSENKTYLFDAPFRKQRNAGGDVIESVPWTLSTAIAYLLNSYNAYWAVQPNSYGDSSLNVFADNGDPEISNVNLEGKSLLEALRTLLVPHNYGFYVTPGFETSSYQKIYFDYRGNATNVATVRLEARDTNAHDSTANLINAELTIDGSAVVNNLTAVGDRIEVTTLAHTKPPTTVSEGDLQAMKLVPGWKLTDLVWGTVTGGKVNPYAPTFRRDYCNEYLITKRGTGPSAKGLFGIGRLWLVNQGQNPNYDLESLSLDLGASNSVDLRRLEQPELYDRNVENALLNQTDIVVELSFDGGTNWRICERNWYRVLPEGMGIVFTNVQQLELLGFKWVNSTVPSGTNYWQGLYDSFYGASEDADSALQIRIICAVKSDEKVKSLNPNDGTALPLAVERQFENTGYRKIAYNELINDAIYYVDFPPARNVRDDTDALGEIAAVQLANTNRLLVSGQFVVLLSNIGEYAPLYQISAILNRMTFDWPPTVLRVIYDFPSQHVHLVVDNRNVKSILKAKPTGEGEDARQHHFGIDSLQGGQGHQVPFLPGIDSSMRDSFRRQAAGGDQ